MRQEESHPDGWSLRRRGPPGRCADQRSAFPGLPAIRVVSVPAVSEHPGQLGEERPVVHEFVVELRGSLLALSEAANSLW